MKKLCLAALMLACLAGGGCLQRLVPPSPERISYAPVVAWKADLGAPVALPLHAHENMLVAVAGSTIFVLDADTGTPLHREETPHEWHDLRGSGTRVLLSAPGVLWLWDAEKRAAVWKREGIPGEPEPAGFWAGDKDGPYWVYVTGGLVCMVAAEEGSEEICLSLEHLRRDRRAHRSGPQMRERPPQEEFHAGHVLEDGTLFVSGRDGILYALSLGERRLLWSRTFKGGVSSPPTVARKAVYAGGADKKLYCLSRDSGRRQWALQTGGYVLPAPILYEGRLYAASNDLFLYALYAHGGHRVWNVNLPKRSDGLLLLPEYGVAAKPRFHPSFEVRGFERGDPILEYQLEDKDDYFLAPLVWHKDMLYCATYRGIVAALRIVKQEADIQATAPEEGKPKPEPPAGAPMTPGKKDEPKPY